MPLIILGGIYGGVFTATEAAAVSAIYAIPVGIWVYKACTIKGFLQMTKEASSTIGSIMVIDRMLSDAQPCIYYLQSSVTGTRPSDGNYNKQISVTFYY